MEERNLHSQIVRAGTSIVLAIAEGSTGQTDAEQSRFLGIAVRSLFESVACQHVIHRRKYLPDEALLKTAYGQATVLARKISSMRNTLAPGKRWVRESPANYLIDEGSPFSEGQ